MGGAWRPSNLPQLPVEGRWLNNSGYHNPPDYLIFEPEDTSERTANLQQTNTNGYKFQTDKSNIVEAAKLVESWGADAKLYSVAKEYQDKLRELHGRFVYRLDTNYAKLDRIEHLGIEQFKTKVFGSYFNGKSIREWSSALSSNSDSVLESALSCLI